MQHSARSSKLSDEPSGKLQQSKPDMVNDQNGQPMLEPEPEPESSDNSSLSKSLEGQ